MAGKIDKRSPCKKKKMIEERMALFHNDGGIHIEDEVVNSQSSDDQIEGHITLAQVQCLIEHASRLEDGEIDNYVLKHNTFMMEHKVKRVNKFIDIFKQYWEDALPTEMIIAFDESNGDIDELTMNLLRPDFKDSVKKILKSKLEHKVKPVKPVQPVEQARDDEDADDCDDEAKDGDYVQPVSVEVSRTVTHRHTKSNPQPHGVIPPCPAGVKQEDWINWSEARRSSYLRGQEYPNAYYYRHLPPGEKQKNGGWTAAEKANFLNRVREFRGNQTFMSGDWGLFSKTIPGRVGYQCANFYRKLVESGEIYDSNYEKGEDGRIHHKSRIHDGKIVVKAKGKVQQRHVSKPAKIIPPNKIRSIRLIYRQELMQQQALPVTSESAANDEHLSRYEAWAAQNPLENTIDPITQEPIRVPAISPDGYVLDYNTWLNVLKTNKENPFTRVPVTKRQLVVLTDENIDEYRDKIVNLNGCVDEEEE